MRGGRTLIIIVLVFVILAAGAYLLWNFLGPKPEATPDDYTPIPTVTKIDIVVSAQDPIPLGWRFKDGDGAAMLEARDEDSLPAGYITSLDQLNGFYAIEDIPQGMPIVRKLLSEEVVSSIPSGRIGYGVAMDAQGGIGWHLKEGDHVDVLAAIKLMSVDPEFQSKLPNLYQAFDTSGGDGLAGESSRTTVIGGVYGRFEALPNGMDGIIFPGGDSIPQLIVQLTVQDAIVWRIGVEQSILTPTPEAFATAATDTGGAMGITVQQQSTPVTPAPQTAQRRSDVELISLLVTPQDALVLKYLVEIGADLDLAIRPPGNTMVSITEPVWTRYILDRYQIPETGYELPVAPTPVREPLELTPLATPTPEGEEK